LPPFYLYLTRLLFLFNITNTSKKNNRMEKKMLPLRTDDKAAFVLLCLTLCLQTDDAIARIEKT
jgi:hypothetical protein